MAFEIFTTGLDSKENLLYVGDGMGYIRVFDLENLLYHINATHIPSSFKEKRQVFNKIEDVYAYSDLI